MSKGAPSQSESPVPLMRHRVSLTICARDTYSRFSRHGTVAIRSHEFFCPHDSNLVTFTVELTFEEEWLSVRVLTNVDKPLVIIESSFTITDIHGKLIATKKYVKRHSLSNRSALVCNELAKRETVEIESTLKFICQLEYEEPSRDKSSVREALPDLSLQIQDDLLKLLESSNNADVTFLVQGQRLSGHKGILSARSKYFERMFDSTLRENVFNEVVVPDVQPLPLQTVH